MFIAAPCMSSVFSRHNSFFNYNWRKEAWNLFFIIGILFGGVISALFLNSSEPVEIHSDLASELAGVGVSDYSNLVPPQLFSWNNLLTFRGFLLMVVGGFLVGFGTRYAGGCTSGHAIMGLSNLQWPSLIATCCFMIGGFIGANLLLPLILKM